MATKPAWDHTQYGFLGEEQLRRFCALCVKRRKENCSSEREEPVRMCARDSVNYSEILPWLSLGQRKAMLALGFMCDEVYDMDSTTQRGWAGMDAEELDRVRREQIAR